MVNVFRWLFENTVRKSRIHNSKERTELDNRKPRCAENDSLKTLNKLFKVLRKSSEDTVKAHLLDNKLRQVEDIRNLNVGDVLVNCNGLYRRHNMSENFLRVGVVQEILHNGKVRVSWVEPLYQLGSSHNEERVYSRGWIEKVFWYKRPKQERTMSKGMYVVTSPTEHVWSARIAGAIYKQGQMIDNLETAELVAQQAATEYSGKEFFVCKAHMKVVKNCLSVTRFDD